MRRYEHITDARRREVRDDIVQRYTSGQSIRGIALDLGRSYGFVHRMLLEQDGLSLRSRGALGRRQQAEAASAVSDSSAASIAPPAISVLVPEEEEVDFAGESEIVTAEEDPAARGDETAELDVAEEELPGLRAAAPAETAEPAFAEDSELADIADSSDDALLPPPALLGVVMPPPPTPLGAVAAPAVDVPLFDY